MMPESDGHDLEPSDAHDLLRRAFDAYNRQDATALLNMLAEDVSWPGWSGLLHGKAEVARFLAEQWERTRTVDEVVGFDRVAHDYVVVTLQQVVRSLDGRYLSSGRFRYGFVVQEGLIARLRTRDA